MIKLKHYRLKNFSYCNDYLGSLANEFILETYTTRQRDAKATLSPHMPQNEVSCVYNKSSDP